MCKNKDKNQENPKNKQKREKKSKTKEKIFFCKFELLRGWRRGTHPFTMETLSNGLILIKTHEGLEISGRTFEYRERLKAKGGRWNPERKTWIFAFETDFSDMRSIPTPSVPQRYREPVEPNMWVFDRVRNARRRECCSQCKREFDTYNPQGPMWFVCSVHGKWKSDYDGT